MNLGTENTLEFAARMHARGVSIQNKGPGNFVVVEGVVFRGKRETLMDAIKLAQQVMK